MNRTALFVLTSTAFHAVDAQRAGTPDSLRSTISGSVRDSLGIAVTGASVLITPGGIILRTDSAGRFVARSVPPGSQTIGLRKLGFSPFQTNVQVHAGVDLTIDLVMRRIPQVLAEVEVTTERSRQCARYSIEGILCRREVGAGIFIDRQQILATGEVLHPRLVLRDTPGFRRNLTGRNHNTVESIVGWRCISWVYDGGRLYSYNPIQRVKDLFAIEVYQPSDVPPEYQHLNWQGKPCTLVMMWSMGEAQRQLRRLGTPK